MSTIRTADPGFSFELKLLQLQTHVEKTSPSSISQFPSIFQQLSDQMFKANTPKKLEIIFSVINRNKLLEKQDGSNNSVKFLFFALKSIQYGLTQDRDKRYKDSWKNLSEKNLKEKVERLQAKIPKLRDALAFPDEQNVGPPEKNSESVQGKKNAELPISSSEMDKDPLVEPSNTKKKEKSKDNVKTFADRFKGSLSSAKGKLWSLRGRANSTTVLDLEKLPSSNHPRPSLFDVFTKEKPQVSETFESKNEITTERTEAQEVFFWKQQFYVHAPENPPEILLKFQQEMMKSLQEKESAYSKLFNSTPDEKLDLLKQSVNFYLDEVFSRVENDLVRLQTEHILEIQDEVFTRSFIASSFLVHLYHASLQIDKTYIEKSWLKPKLIDEVLTAFHLEKPLLQLLPMIDKMPILAGAQGRIRHAESALAYQHLRKQSKTKWLTLTKFEANYKSDPLTQSGLGHRPSAAELPKWIMPWLNLKNV